MRPPDGPVPLTADERFTVVAAILAAAILWLRARVALAVVANADTGSAGLEVFTTTGNGV